MLEIVAKSITKLGLGVLNIRLPIIFPVKGM
jgi:hypothetical protein